MCYYLNHINIHNCEYVLLWFSSQVKVECVAILLQIIEFPFVYCSNSLHFVLNLLGSGSSSSANDEPGMLTLFLLRTWVQLNVLFEFIEFMNVLHGNTINVIICLSVIPVLTSVHGFKITEHADSTLWWVLFLSCS